MMNKNKLIFKCYLELHTVINSYLDLYYCFGWVDYGGHSRFLLVAVVVGS